MWSHGVHAVTAVHEGNVDELVAASVNSGITRVTICFPRSDEGERMTVTERAATMGLLRDPKLIDPIVADLDCCGTPEGRLRTRNAAAPFPPSTKSPSRSRLREDAAAAGFRARVRNGRLVLDEPTDLPEGEEVELVPADAYDMDDDERAALHESLREGIRQMKAGETIDADVAMAELRAHR